MKLPVKVQTAVDAYKDATGKAQGLSTTHSQRAEELRSEIAVKRAKLDAATDASLMDPTPQNVEKENALQREIAMLTMEMSAAEERSLRVFGRSSAQMEVLARTAVETARVEATTYHQEHYDKKMSAVEEAKYAYLKALVDVHTLGEETRGIFLTAAQETNPRLAEAGYSGQISGPHIPEPTLHYRSGVQVHGISEPEITRALKYGKIRKGDVAPGREIE
ncbi:MULTISPECIES: hypothetical protein [unclassified Paenibacillus]|uniref:hypothetical protein n=1 Tax=unclassified Paenibacillus TaxID=185978 RepID=UPI0030F99209